MTTYVMRDGKLVEKRLAPPPAAANGQRVHVISDVMDACKHMATGEVLDSKSEFRKRTRAAGCVEVGNDPASTRERRPEPSTVGADDVRRAISDWNNMPSHRREQIRAAQENVARRLGAR